MPRALVLLLVACAAPPGGPTNSAPVDEGGAPPGPDGGALGDGGAPAPGRPDAGGGGWGGGFVDFDRDGLDDRKEAELAALYLPSLARHPADRCPLGGLIYRARPHPLDATLVFILYVHLYERDCGLGSHLGDNEAFAVTVNPDRPPPAGLTALKAIAHQATACQKVTACGACAGLAPCEAGDGGQPLLYASRNKHGKYAQKRACSLLSLCPDDCAPGEELGVPLVNVGEPHAHLVEDLTSAGFITPDAGWSQAALFHFDPWGPHEFGGAGKPSGDLVDPAFDTPACR